MPVEFLERESGPPGHTDSLLHTSESQFRRFRVLLVEDSNAVARIFAKILERMGHEVQVAGNGPAALEQLPAFYPEVVFSDISMPGMNGYELARRIRQDPRFRRLYLVATTGYGQPEDRQRALEAGYDEHLVKPAGIDQLQKLFEAISSRPAA